MSHAFRGVVWVVVGVVGGGMKLYWGLVSVESRVVGEWGQKVVWWGSRVVGVGGLCGGGVMGW